MAVITKLERQKHNKERISVFVDGEYAFSLSEDTLFEYGVETGKDINGFPLKEMTEEDEYRSALKKGYTLLSGSAKSEKQLKEKLLQKGFDRSAVEKAVSRIKENGYLDDLAYCEDFMRNTLLGRRGIEYKLISRGINRETVSRVLEETDDGFFMENANRLLEKNKKKFEKLTGYAKKNKMYTVLLQNGYESDIISCVIGGGDYGEWDE